MPLNFILQLKVFGHIDYTVISFAVQNVLKSKKIYKIVHFWLCLSAMATGRFNIQEQNKEYWN